MEDRVLIAESIRSNLCDKTPEKRKQAQYELEWTVRNAFKTAASSNSPGQTLVAFQGQVAREIDWLVQECCQSAYPLRRKGGLTALASIAIGLDQEHIKVHVPTILEPILICLSDEDPTVRYTASEAFYNVAKVARAGILYNVKAVFDGLCRLYADVDQSVKDGAQCLDRLVRDIVTECRDFDYPSFIPLLTARIRVLNPAVRQLVLGWLVLLDSVPQVDMIAHLSQYLEGLFGVLASDNRDIRRNAEVCLKELITQIRTSATERPARAQKAVTEAAKTVARCCRAGERRAEDNYVRLNALQWLLEFVKLQGELEGIPTQGDDERGLSPVADVGSPSRLSHLRASSQGGPGSPITAAPLANQGANSGMRQLVPVLLTGALHCLDDQAVEIQLESEEANKVLTRAAQALGAELPVEQIAEAVLGAMREGASSEHFHRGEERSPNVVLKCIAWAQLMLNQCPIRVLQPGVREQLLDTVLAVLLRAEDEVAIAALRFVADLVAINDTMANMPEAGGSRFGGGAGQDEAQGSDQAPAEEDLFASVLKRLFAIMSQRPKLLKTRGDLIMRQLCEAVDAERFYATVAKTVCSTKDYRFARHLVWVLNRVLLRARETRTLRAKLRAAAAPSLFPTGVAGDPVPPELPSEILRAWCHCPVSALSLAMWLHWFDLAAQMVVRLDTMELTEELQAQLIELVELFESPIFVRVRLQLLDAKRQPALLNTVLGLVALLPQEKALRARLEYVKAALLLEGLGSEGRAPPPSCALASQLSLFDEMADKHGLRLVL